jgi:hypothetical protein
LSKLGFVERCEIMIRIAKGEIEYVDDVINAVEGVQITFEGNYPFDK